jgi:hypothetical protein
LDGPPSQSLQGSLGMSMAGRGHNDGSCPVLHLHQWLHRCEKRKQRIETPSRWSFFKMEILWDNFWIFMDVYGRMWVGVVWKLMQVPNSFFNHVVAILDVTWWMETMTCNEECSEKKTKLQIVWNKILWMVEGVMIISQWYLEGSHSTNMLGTCPDSVDRSKLGVPSFDTFRKFKHVNWTSPFFMNKIF